MATDITQRAVDAAQQKYTAAYWINMRPQDRTAAIYAEMRRLDAEASESAQTRSKRREPCVQGRSSASPAAEVHRKVP